MAEAALLGLVALAGSAQVEADPLPRYQAVLEQELTTLKLDPACTAVSATETHCELTMGTPAGQRFEARAIYSDVTDTVYLYVPDFLELPASSASTDGVLRRLMELNAELLACKLEWHPASGEVRLSTLLHTDSNFDRRSLRGLVHALRRAAMRYQGELQRLAGNDPDARPRAAAP